MKKTFTTVGLAVFISTVSFVRASNQAFGLGLQYSKTVQPDVTWCDEIEGARFGDSIAMGDVNGDGFDDVLITAPNEKILTYMLGITRVYEGSTNGIKEPPILQINVPSEAVATADVNNDGFDDIILGGQGCINAYYGNAGWTGFDPPLNLDSSDADWTECLGVSTQFGNFVANTGDVNGDGIDDIIASAPGENKTYGFYGSASGLPADHAPDFIVPEGPGTQLGIDYSITGFGMVAKSSEYYLPGSGWFDNFIIGASTSDIDLDNNGSYSLSETNIGVVLNGPRWWFLSGDNVPYSYFGYALGNGGDVNDDGKTDIIASAKKTSSVQPKVFVYLGKAGSVVESDYAWAVEGITDVTSDLFGSVVGSAGDINGDGYGDILIADPLHDGRPDLPPDHLGYWGRIHIWYGGPSSAEDPSGLGQGQTPLDADIILDGGFASGMFGDAFAAGDINNDGVSDVAVGVPRGAGWCYVPPDGTETIIVETGFVEIYHSDFPSSGLIFQDGFESGDTSAWSHTVP